MGKIVLLDEVTINKIAAGEVVDRPASIVKELVENSIDAKASQITVEIKNGGITYIKVTDDGKGIEKDDIEIAFERHATSKIRKETDISKISSMGFRGEALASISSISKVTLETKTKEDYTGTKIVVEGGIRKELTEIPFITGTTITIENVFYNVPARYKFLKKDSVEASYIEEMMIKLALSHPNICIKYVNNSKVIFRTGGSGDINTVVLNIFGSLYANSLLDIDFEYEDLKVTGVIGMPSMARGTRQNEFTFVNNRYVKNKIINTAIEKAYEQNINIGKFPFVVLDIIIKPEEIDVNVHPAKLEVKFENETKIFNLIYSAVTDRLTKYHRSISPFYAKDSTEEISNISGTNAAPLIKNTATDVSASYAIAINDETTITNTAEIENNNMKVSENKLQNINYYTEEIKMSNIENINSQTTNLKEDSYKYIGAAFDTYIIIEVKDKLYMIDQHAAHERLIYESIKDMYYKKEKQTQMLIIPTLVRLINADKIFVMENIDMFEKAGYIIEEFGTNEIKISGVPNIGYNTDFKEMFEDLIDVLRGSLKTYSEEKEKRFIYTLACKAAVKANMGLTKEEHTNLIDKMMKLEKPFTCPHGRPTAFEMSKYEIERKLARK